jgi:hypothetical protein
MGNNIKTDYKKYVRWVNWITVSQDSDHGRAFVKAVTILQFVYWLPFPSVAEILLAFQEIHSMQVKGHRNQ